MKKTLLDVALERYYKRFDAHFPLLVADGRSYDEIIAEIAECIKKGEKAKPIELKKGCVY